MKFRSTRRNSPEIDLQQAILTGLAPDGGLYVPIEFPNHIGEIQEDDFATFAKKAIEPFAKGSDLENRLEEVCNDAFNFKLVSDPFHDNWTLLELFHGPTAAFKDFGARFLAKSMSVSASQSSEKPIHILVATSGDTGGAVASAYHKLPGTKVTILFPAGKVSPRQEKQLTCWGDNISSVKVSGTFDECQDLVKRAFSDSELKAEHNLNSANSINIGRLLPQMAYHAYSSYQYFKTHGKKPTLIIPTGNLGNAVGAFWAKHMGSPIENIVLAVNKNRTIPDFFEQKEYQGRKSVPTLANAMDVGVPSNLERLIDLHTNLDDLKKISSSYSINDEEITKTIEDSHKTYKRIICPHTAVGIKVAQDHFAGKDCIISATAHPAKFESIVEPLLNLKVPVPENLLKLLEIDGQFIEASPDVGARELLNKLVHS